MWEYAILMRLPLLEDLPLHQPDVGRQAAGKSGNQTSTSRRPTEPDFCAGFITTRCMEAVKVPVSVLQRLHWNLVNLTSLDLAF